MATLFIHDTYTAFLAKKCIKKTQNGMIAALDSHIKSLKLLNRFRLNLVCSESRLKVVGQFNFGASNSIKNTNLHESLGCQQNSVATVTRVRDGQTMWDYTALYPKRLSSLDKRCSMLGRAELFCSFTKDLESSQTRIQWVTRSFRGEYSGRGV
jgi:hypothetical protein